jgi:hypothetical protein
VAILTPAAAVAQLARASACHAEGRGFESLQPLPKRSAFAGLFRRGSRQVRLRRVGLKPDSRPADRRRLQRKRPVRSPIPGRPNRSPSAGPQKTECSARRGRKPALPAKGDVCVRIACRRDIRDPRPRGRVRSQSGNREVDLGPPSTRHKAGKLPPRRVYASGAVPSPSDWASAITRGHRRG